MSVAVNLCMCVGGGVHGLLPLPLKDRVDKEELDTRIDQTRTLPDRLSDRHRIKLSLPRRWKKNYSADALALFYLLLLLFALFQSGKVERFLLFFFIYFQRSKPLLGRIDCFSDNPGLFTKDRLSLFHKTTFIRSARKMWMKKRELIYLCICWKETRLQRGEIREKEKRSIYMRWGDFSRFRNCPLFLHQDNLRFDMC